MDNTADRVMMRLAKAVHDQADIAHGLCTQDDCPMIARFAVALSSHGLRELIDRSIAHVEATKRVYEAEHHSLPALSKIAHQQLYEAANKHDKILTALLAEGETREPFEPLEEYAL